MKPRVQSTLELFFWATCKAPGAFLGIMLNLGWDKKPGRLSDGFNSYIHIIEKNEEKNSRQLYHFFFSLKIYKNADCFMDKPYIEFNSKERQPRKCAATACELNFSVIGYFYCYFVFLNR